MRVALERPERPDWICEEHHIFNGRGIRKWSDKYNCVIYIPSAYHNRITNDAKLRKKLKAEYQEKLEDAGWTREEFIETFGRNYL